MAQDDADRINGLMATLGRKESANKALRDQIAELTQQLQAQDAPSLDTSNDNGSAGLAAEAAEAAEQWEPGTELIVNDDGQLEEKLPPMMSNPNEMSYLGRGRSATGSKEDDGSSEYARDQMFRQLGETPDPKGWLP